MAQTAPTQDRPVSLRLGSTVSWDANVLRVPDSVTDPLLSLGKRGRSDQIHTTSIGLRFEKAFSLQYFLFDVTDTATRYDKFSSLNRDLFNYRGAWLWQLSPRIGGTFSADHTESVINFEDLVLGQQRIATAIDNRAATVDALLTGGWHLLAGAYQLERKNSIAFLAVPNVHQTTGELGLRYVAASQNSVAFIARTRRGIIPGQALDVTTFFLDNEFAVRESELNAAWAVGGRSTLTGRVTRIDYRYEHVRQRDFSGTAGELRYAWAPAGKLDVTFSALRNVLPWTPDAITSYRVDNNLSFAPVWRLSDRTSLRFVASRLSSDYLGPVVPAVGPLRHDVLRSVQFGADWLPVRGVTLAATLRRDRRTSNDAAFSFDAKILGLNAAVAF